MVRTAPILSESSARDRSVATGGLPSVAALEGAQQSGARLTYPWLDPRKADEDASRYISEALDRFWRYLASRWTLGLSPMAVAEAYFDWMIHLAASPGKQLQLAEKAVRKSALLAHYAAHCSWQSDGVGPCIEPLAQDKRFRGEAWQRWPFNVIYQSFLLQQQWWHGATTGIRGLGDKHEAQVTFATRQALDMISPANFIFSNPEVLQKTLAEGGGNLVRGYWNFIEDWGRAARGEPPHGAEAFEVGRNLAVSAGKVIYRNRLIELIQYAPTTDKVRREPVLIVPAWIMKYYILDLTPQNSLVKYLNDQGFTVFMISWKNPGYEDRELGMEDYRKLGVMAALEEVGKVVPDQKVHAVGYCLGGTLLSIAAAAMARDRDDRIATLSFLAAQTDFEEAGELTLFVVASQIAFLEDMMREQGYLDVHQMAGAFQMLHSNDLIWSRVIHDYLMGERAPMNDLMAWNADGTRMPAKMHSEYLRQLFLKNDLAEGRFKIDGRPITLTDVRTQLFAVGTETDHVAPWRSVFKFHLLMDTDVTFVLTNGGHNGGIVSEPGRKRRRFRLRTKREHEPYVDPETWFDETAVRDGSWWPEWTRWLAKRSSGWAQARGLDPRLADAPGTYVLQR